MPVIDDPVDAVRKALSGVAGPSLENLAKGRRSACIVVCDITRPVPNGLFLPELVRTLLRSKIAAEKIQILIATGLHRPNEGDELAEVIGDSWVLETVAVRNHFASNPVDLIDLGRTPTRGTRVLLNRAFVEADLRIVTGLVEPHFMAGYSGGRKVVAPGIAGEETIRTFHNAAFMSHSNAINCVLNGNPLHEEQLAIVGMVGDIFALNTVIDEHRNLSFVNFGEVVRSHLEAVDFVRPFVELPMARRFQTVVTSAAGYPLDKTYYQTVKGMVGPLEILEPGGDMIVASACEEGIGSKGFAESQRRLRDQGTNNFLAGIAKKPLADIDEWQSQMQTRTTRVGNVQLFTDGLSESDSALTGVRHIRSLNEAIARSMERSRDPEIAIVPEGPYVVPRWRPAA